MITLNENFVRHWAWLCGLFPLGNLILLAGTLGLDVVVPVQLLFIAFPIVANIALIAVGAALKQRGLGGWAVAGFCLSLLLIVLGVAFSINLVDRGFLSMLAPILLCTSLLIVDSIAIGFLARCTGNTPLYVTTIVIALIGLSRVGEQILWLQVIATALYIILLLPRSQPREFKPRVVPRKTKVTIGAITIAGLAMAALVPYVIVGNLGDQEHPKFIVSDFVQMSKISNVSRFRSHAGHEYVDSYEGGERSMKHYFTPATPYKNSSSSIEIYAPADVFVANIAWEGHEMVPGQIRGFHVDLVPVRAPTYKITIFHVNVTGSLIVGTLVRAGQLLGYADTRYASDFDIAIDLLLPLGPSRHVSYFAVMDDEAFGAYQDRGVTSRTDMIISRADADAAEGISMPMSWDWFTLT